MLFFHNLILFTGDGTLKDGCLLIRDGKIAALGAAGSSPPPSSAQIVDANGLIAAPGYIDIQINGGFGKDFTETPDAIYEVAACLPAYGVTAFLPTIITSPAIKIELAMRTWQQGPPPRFRGAIPLGLHLEGPMINPLKKGAHNPAYMRSPSLELIDGWSPERGVRMVTLAPELSGTKAVIQELNGRGIVISAGHTTATYDEGMQVFETGVQCGTHLFNAMPSLHHRSPGITGALLQHPNVCTGLIVDGVHVHPAVVNLAWRSKAPDKLILVSDAMAALGMPIGRYQLGGYMVSVDPSSGVRLPDGTLAGSTLSMDAAVRNLISFSGCTLAQAAACASVNPAQLLGLDNKGKLAPGMDADLVLLSSEGFVQATLVQGQVLYSKIPLLEVIE